MDDELTNLLQWFGFTEKEIESFTTILKYGPVTIQDIVEQSTISQRHVYNTVEKLERYNLVIVNDYLTPTVVEPAPPEEVYDYIESKFNELQNELDSRYRRGPEVIDDITVIKTQSSIITHVKEMIGECEALIAMSIPVELISSFEEELRMIMDRDELVLLLISDNGNEDISSLAVDPSNLAHAVRYTTEEVPVLVAIDETYVLVGPGDLSKQYSRDNRALYIRGGYMARIAFSALMDSEWKLGEEYAVSTPTELPHTYSSIGRAVFDAALYERQGVSLHAEVDAVLVDSPGTNATVSGLVHRVTQRFIEPIGDAPPKQSTLEIETEDGIVSIGGIDANIEDYRTHSLELRREN